MTTTQPTGTVGWLDLTTDKADELRDFYADVMGWQFDAHDMGDYSDYVMKTADGTAVAGVCHARGTNEGLPAQWLMYVTVTDLDGKLDACRTRGGKVLAGPKSMGGQGRYCIIQDPAGAVSALIESA